MYCQEHDRLPTAHLRARNSTATCQQPHWCVQRLRNFASRRGQASVVFASSGAAAGGFECIAPYDAIAEGSYDQVPENYERITPDTTWPNGVYGATKVWG